jgi:hypothetical protein
MADVFSGFRLQVFGAQSRFLGNPGEKSGPDFFVVMEGECKVRSVGPFESTVGPVLPSDFPSNSEQCG